jgi:hypothetical protein
MPNPRSSLVLLSQQEREKLLFIMTRLQCVSLRLGAELNKKSETAAIKAYKAKNKEARGKSPQLTALDALPQLRQAYDAAKKRYKEAKASSLEEAKVDPGEMLAARQEVDDQRAKAIQEVEALLQQLFQYSDDQFCQGLYDAIRHELFLAQRDRSTIKRGQLVYSHIFNVPEINGRCELNLLGAAKTYLKFKLLQAVLPGLKESVAHEEIISCVDRVSGLLNSLPTGKKVELNTYASLTKKITEYLASYKSNDMMKGDVQHALLQAEEEGEPLAQLNYLIKSLMRCVESWVEASKSVNRGSYRARFVAWVNRYHLPKEDPLFHFIVQLIEDTRCPLALEEYASYHHGYDTYAPTSRPSKANVSTLSESPARQLVELARDDAEAKSLKAINAEFNARAIDERRSEERVRFADESSSDIVTAPLEGMGDKVRVLTAHGQRKLRGMKSRMAELKKSLENYARHAAGNRQLAMKVLSKLTLQPTDVLNGTTKQQLENQWGIYFEGGLSTDDKKESKDILKTAFLLNESITALRNAEPTGSFSRCAAIVETALVELTALKFNSKDFISLPILSLSSAIKQIKEILDYDPSPAAGKKDKVLNSLARDSRPAWLDNEKNILGYCQEKLSLLVKNVKSTPPSRQREVLSQGLNRLLSNWRRVAYIEDRLKPLFDKLDKLNEAVSWPTARGENDHLTSAVGVRPDYLSSADDVDSVSAKKAFRYAKQFDFQPENSLKLIGGKAGKLPEEKTYTELSSALLDHDGFSVGVEDDFYQRRYLSAAEHVELEALVGRQFVNLHVENVDISYEFNDQSFNLLTLQKSLLDACQTARLSGVRNDELGKFENKITELFDADAQPNFSAQLHYIKNDPRFKYLSLESLCGFEIHPTTNCGDGVSLLGLYHALKLEKFVEEKIISDYLLCDFNDLPENIRIVLCGAQSKITKHLPVSRELKLLTYKGLVDALLGMFDKLEGNGDVNKLSKTYPELSHAVLSLVLNIEKDSSLRNREEKLEELSHCLMVIIEPYLLKKEFFNPAVSGLLQLIDQTDRQFSSPCRLNWQQDFRSVDGKKVLTHFSDNLNTETPLTAFEVEEILAEKRLEERKILHNKPLSSLQHVTCELTEQQRRVRGQFVAHVNADKIKSDASLPANGNDDGQLPFVEGMAPRDESTFSSQVISQSGLDRINFLTQRKVSALYTAVFRACRAYYVISDDDYDVSGPLWRAHAYALEIQLESALTGLTDSDPATVVHAASGYEQLDLSDFRPEQKKHFAQTLLLLKHVDAMIHQIEAGSWFSQSSFHADLKRARKSIQNMIPQPSDFRSAHVPTWRGALAELSQLIKEMEDHSKSSETLELRLKLLQGLSFTDSQAGACEDDYARMQALAKLLKRTIEEVHVDSLSPLNKKMLDRLAVMHEKITRDIMLGVSNVQPPFGVDGLSREEASQLMRKFKAACSAENSPRLVQELVLDQEFARAEGDALISRSAWLEEIAQDAKVALPQPVLSQSGTFYARNGPATRDFLESDRGVWRILTNLASASRRYSLTKNGFKRHRAFRSLAARVAQKIDRMLDGQIDANGLAALRSGYEGFLHGASDRKKLSLAKLLVAETAIVNTITEIDASGLYVKNSEYRGILTASLKEVRAHLPVMKELYAPESQAVLQNMKAAVNDFNTSVNLGGDAKLIALHDFVNGSDANGPNTSELCRQVATQLTTLVNESYQPTCFGSRRNKYLNNAKILELFKIIERVECPLAQGNKSDDGANYYDFSSDYLLVRLRSKLSGVIVNDADEVKESLRVRNLGYQASVA